MEDTLHQFEADMRGMRVQFTRIRKRTCFMGSLMLWPSGCGLWKSTLMKQQIIHMKFGEPCLYVTLTASVPLLQYIYTNVCGCVCRRIECNWRTQCRCGKCGYKYGKSHSETYHSRGQMMQLLLGRFCNSLRLNNRGRSCDWTAGGYKRCDIIETRNPCLEMYISICKEETCHSKVIHTSRTSIWRLVQLVNVMGRWLDRIKEHPPH